MFLDFEYARTDDCVAEFDGKLCVIDFKTSSRNEIATELLDTHFAQLAAYSHAYNHMNPTTKINKILIIHVSDQLNVLEKQGDEINYYHDFFAAQFERFVKKEAESFSKLSDRDGMAIKNNRISYYSSATYSYCQQARSFI